jgi:hypothetical protein
VGRWIGGVGGFLYVVVAALLLKQALAWRRGLEIRGDLLVVAANTRRRSIPLAEVTGVGLVLSWVPGNGGRVPGWYLTVWDQARTA